MTPHPRAVAVIVLNWNQEGDTTDCLASLRAAEGAALRVILVDNGSSPESVDRLESRFPEASVIRLKENRGFAAGNNVGIERALQDARFNKVKAAKALGLTRGQLYVRLKRHGLE